MILFVNEKSEVKDVDFTLDETLTPLEVNDESCPFLGWSVAKICCYKVEVNEGVVTMMTPYVDSRLIEHIDSIGKVSEKASQDSNDSMECVYDLSDMISEQIANISDLANYTIQLEKRIKKLEGNK